MNGDTDKLVTNVAAINFSGRFKGQEVRDLGQAFLQHVVAAKDIGLVFGQQVGMNDGVQHRIGYIAKIFLGYGRIM